MAKFRTYSFEFAGERFESDSMKDCVEQYYKSALRLWAHPINFEKRFEREKEAWERYLKNHGKTVEIEVEGE